MTVIDFEKWQGAGNDFVLLESPTPALDSGAIRFLLDRRRGVGADGLLLLTRSDDAGPEDLQAVAEYWNADGGQVGYCGNGARCVAARLLETGGRSRVRFRLGQVTVEAYAAESGVGRYSVLQPEPEMGPDPAVEAPVRAAFVLAGVPHVILPVAEIGAFPLETWGPALRHDPAFAPEGTNVDAVELTSDADGPLLLVRTWERGVEGETEACGSGLLSVGYWAHRVRGWKLPIRMRSRSDDFLLEKKNSGYALTGPASRVFEGRIVLP